MNDRVQKFLLTHYRHLYEPTIIESAFAEVDHRGTGIRQFYLGLTQNNFIMCTEQLPPAYGSLMRCKGRIDPELECLELDSIVPLKACEFHVCARYQRNFISVSIYNKKKRYFEFGEHLMRCFYYDVWSDCIFKLNKHVEILHDETSSDSEEDLNELEEKDSGYNVHVLHKNFKFDKNEESIENFPESKMSEKSRKEREKVNILKRRVHKLNHNIKKQFEEVVDDKDEARETTRLLIENEKTREKAGMTASEGKKPVVEIYKNSPKPSMNSFANIWF